MTNSGCCHGCIVICDEMYDEIGTTSWCLDFILGFISNTANLWRNLTVRHGCSVIYDEIWKRHVNIVMDHKVFCSGERKKMKGLGSPPTRLTLFIRGPPNLSVAAPCSVQHALTALSREVCEKIEADFSLTDQALRPKSEFRSSTKREDNIRWS
jgi:hypothetical protein